MLDLYIDADACPVKDEVYRVAERYGLKVFLVSASGVRPPRNPNVHAVIAGDKFDAADDWIAERTGDGDIVITSDIPLATRAVARGSRVITPQGRILEERNVGDIRATRDLMAHLREVRGGNGRAGTLRAQGPLAFPVCARPGDPDDSAWRLDNRLLQGMAAFAILYLDHPDIGIILGLTFDIGVRVGLRHRLRAGGSHPGKLALGAADLSQHGASQRSTVQLDQHRSRIGEAPPRHGGRITGSACGPQACLDEELGFEGRDGHPPVLDPSHDPCTSRRTLKQP